VRSARWIAIAICFTLFAQGASAADEARALAARAGAGEAAALEQLIDRARKRDADAEHALGLLAYEADPGERVRLHAALGAGMGVAVSRPEKSGSRQIRDLEIGV